LRPVTRTVIFAGCSVIFAVFALVGGGLVLRATLPEDSDLEPEPVVAPAGGEAEDSVEQEEALEGAGNVYEETTLELLSAYDESKDALSPELAQSLAEDFSMIEGAIGEIGAALASEPDNESLKRMLVATYRNQMLLLKRALHIVADEAEE